MQTRNIDQAELRSITRWNLITSLLSMDVAAECYDLIGLPVEANASFRDFLRAVILETRRQFPEKDATAIFVLPEHLFDRTAATFGKKMRDSFEAWGTHIFEEKVEEHLLLRHWTTILRYASRRPETWNELGIQGDFNSEVRDAFALSDNTEAFEQRWQEIAKRPLTDWDLHMYAVSGFNDDDPLPINGPYSYLYPVVVVNQQINFWIWLLDNLPPEDKKRLSQNALKLASNTKHLAFIKELPLPTLDFKR